MFIGCGHVLRLSVVKQLGGYSKFPGSYGGEEKDLCLCLIDAGYEITKLTGVHVWHDKTMTARDLADQHASGVCNDLTFTVRRVPIAFLLPMISYKLMSHIVFAFRGGLMRPCIKGIREFGRVLMSTWRGRKPVRISSLKRYQALSRLPNDVVR